MGCVSEIVDILQKELENEIGATLKVLCCIEEDDDDKTGVDFKEK